MRVVAYLRVSTEEQAREGVSLEAQKERVLAWCRASGEDLAAADLFVDAGLSGYRSDNRPGLTAALDAVTAAPGAVLVVYSLSRLARSTRDTIAIAERLERAGADLVSLSEKIDTTSAAGKMVFRMLAVLAEFERDLIAERTRGAMAHKRAKKERISRTAPYGSDLAGDGKTLVDNPRELEAVGLIRAWAAAGRSYRWIGRELDRLGYRPKVSARWAPASIARILSRPAA